MPAKKYPPIAVTRVGFVVRRKADGLFLPKTTRAPRWAEDAGTAAWFWAKPRANLYPEDQFEIIPMNFIIRETVK